jgi:hypothetical protein
MGHLLAKAVAVGTGYGSHALWCDSEVAPPAEAAASEADKLPFVRVYLQFLIATDIASLTHSNRRCNATRASRDLRISSQANQLGFLANTLCQCQNSKVAQIGTSTATRKAASIQIPGSERHLRNAMA